MISEKQSSKSLSRPVQPPLIEKEWTETDPETGGEIHVTQQQRGVFATESRSYDSLALRSLAKQKQVSPREAIEEVCNNIRDNLEKLGLPSDRTPSWIRVGDGGWEPFRNDHEPSNAGVRYAPWISRLEELTEPLSKERIAGKLLHAIVNFLKRKDVEKHLDGVARLMNLFADYRISGTLNHLVHQAIVGRKGRAQGPIAKRRRAGDVRRIVMAHAESYWLANPLLRGAASNTAASIASSVNEELRSNNLAPSGKEGLSVKTIGDHIRHGIRG